MRSASLLHAVVEGAWWVASLVAWLSAAAFLYIGVVGAADRAPFLGAGAISVGVGALLVGARRVVRARALARARAERGPPAARVVRGG